MLFKKINQRIILSLAVAGAALLTACSSDTGSNAQTAASPITVEKNKRNSDNYILGADISSLGEMIDKGAVFVDTDGQEKSLFALLKNHGFNYIRLRTFVDPSAQYGYASGDGQWCDAKSEAYNDKAHTIEMAKLVKAAGMKLLLDFHYSDTWADPNKQVIPNAWRNFNTIEDLSAALESYTIDVLTDLKAAGIEPDMIQVGNEITPGMLIHTPTSETDCFGNNSSINETLNGSTEQFDNFAKLLKAGIDSVKKVNAQTPIMLHIENTGDRAGIQHWVNQVINAGITFDVLGLSAYEKWQGPSNQWEGTLGLLADTYPKLNFSIVEYNPQARLLNDIMYNLPDNRGLGTFFWEPVLSGEWGSAIFTQKGNVYTANPENFAIYDQIIADYGL